MVKMDHRCDPDQPCDGQGWQFDGHVFNVCPYDALQDPYFATASHLADAQETQPLADWPVGFSWGMSFAIQVIRAGRIRKARRDAAGNL